MSLPGRPPRGRGPEDERHVVMSAGRGAVLVGIAVLVGLLIFLTLDGANGGGGGGGSTPTPTTPAATSGTTGTTTGGGSAGTTATTTKKKTTTTTAAKSDGKLRSNDQVVVQVLNGSGVQGAATQRSNDLKAKGYQVLPAGNAPSTRTGTVVQCKSGYEKEAAALAATLQTIGVPATVSGLPDPLPSGYEASANCYVLLGK